MAKQDVSEKVSFENDRGERLVGMLLAATSSKTVILCHGYADTKAGFHLPALAEALANQGYSSLRQVLVVQSACYLKLCVLPADISSRR